MEDRVVIRYGDRVYTIEVTGLRGEELKHSIMSYIYEAMREFHRNEKEINGEIYRLKGALHELAAENTPFRERIIDILMEVER